MANVSADVGEHSEADERGGMVQGSNGAMGNANDGGMCAATAGRMASGHGTMVNDAPAIAQRGEQQQNTYSTVPALLQHTPLKLVLQREDEEQEQHEQIADGVEGTPDGTAQQHGGSSSAHVTMLRTSASSAGLIQGGSTSRTSSQKATAQPTRIRSHLASAAGPITDQRPRPWINRNRIRNPISATPNA